MAHPTFFGRTEWFKTHKYRAAMPWYHAEDQDLLYRSYRYCQLGNLQEILLGYREDKFTLKKRLLSRLALARVMLEASVRHKQYYDVFSGTLVQVTKAIADCAAAMMRLEIKRGNRRGVTGVELSAWRNLLDDLK